ncbi:MAG: hypothetical protein ACMXYL_02995 [Candidatus Woesearchaeota archaeon]
MNPYKRIMAATLLIVLFIGGCNGSSSTNINEGYGFITARIQSLAPNSNVLYVYHDNQDTMFIAELQNDMFMQAENLMIVPDNFNPEVIQLGNIQNSFPITMRGYNMTTRIKDHHIIEVPVPLNTRVIQGRPYSTNVRFHMCAVTRTYLETQMCIRHQSTLNPQRSTCTPGPVSLTRGQGAPVAFTSIRQYDSGNMVTFHINVVNRGSGLVYDSSEREECGFIGQDSIGIINLDYLMISGRPATCDRTTERMGYTRQYQASSGTTFICRIDKGDIGMSDAESPQQHVIEAQLSYNYYTELPSQNIIIRNAPGYGG